MRWKKPPRPGSAILARAVASGRRKYSRVTTGPATMISPIVPSLSSRSSDQVGIGSSLIRMIRTSTPSTGRPTHTPAPRSVCVPGLLEDLGAADRRDRQRLGGAVGGEDLGGRLEQAGRTRRAPGPKPALPR